MAFYERGWATPEGTLTPEGERVHQKVPELLRDAAFSRTIEAHIAERAAEGWGAAAIVRSAFTRFSSDLAPPPLRLRDRTLGLDIDGRARVSACTEDTNTADTLQPSKRLTGLGLY